MSEFRVLVCGGRDFGTPAERDQLMRLLDRLFCPVYPADEEGRAGTWVPAPGLVIIHGDGCGADTCAADWATSNWVQTREFPADWAAYGRSAGPRRNQRMLDEGKPHLVIAFPGGAGTADMVKRARAARVPVMEVFREESAQVAT